MNIKKILWRRKLSKSRLKLILLSGSITGSLLLSGCGSSDKLENSAPVFKNSSTVSVQENQIKAITLVASDSDKDTLTYSISGTDASSFNINSSTGVVSFKTAPDYETKISYSFTANVSDGINTTTQNVTINISDVNETVPVVNTAPVFTSESTVSVKENQTSAIILTATDTNGDTLTYSISGTDSSSFNINSSTGVVSFKTAPDYETKTSYSFTANVSDGINTTTQNVTINISDVNETAKDINLATLKTGQTTSYKDGDDGYYQKGTSRSFSRGSDIVTDNITGLQWQDDEEAKTVKKQWVTSENYNAGNYSDTSGDTAITYCSSLTLGGYSDWRLPTYSELKSIVDYGRYNPSINSEFQNVVSSEFQNVVSSFYWSSITYASGTSSAWAINFDHGDGGWDIKARSHYVRCVRTGQ